MNPRDVIKLLDNISDILSTVNAMLFKVDECNNQMDFFTKKINELEEIVKYQTILLRQVSSDIQKPIISKPKSKADK